MCRCMYHALLLSCLLLALGLGGPLAQAQGPQPRYIIVSDPIDEDTTWTAINSPYIVQRDLTIKEGIQLTIEPGVVVKFDGAWVRMLVDGSLVAQGTAQQPIVFTSFKDDAHGGDTNRDHDATEPKPGDWGGIFLNPGSSNRLEHVWIGYGGGFAPFWKPACLSILSSDTIIRNSTIAWSKQRGIHVKDASPTLEGNEFRNNATEGIYFDGFDATQPVTLRDNTFVDNGSWAAHAALSAETVDVTLSGNTSTGSAGNGFGMLGSIAGDVTYSTDPAFPFIIKARTTVSETASLTLRQGTVVKFYETTGLHVDGALLAQGSAQKPVVFTSIRDDAHGGDTNGDGDATQAAPGDWTALYFNAGSHDNVLQHVWIGYGGGGGYRQSGAVNVYGDELTIRDSTIGWSGDEGIYLEHTPATMREGATPSADGTGLEVTGSTILYNNGHGLYADAGVTVEATKNRFIGNGAAAIKRHTEANVIARGNEAQGNRVNGIAFAGLVAQDTVLESGAALPIVIDAWLTVGAGATLEIKPAQRVEFMPAQSLIVSGTLLADNVWFTRHYSDTCWGAIAFEPGSQGTFRNHCLVEYGSADGMIYIEGASPTIGDTLLRYSCKPGQERGRGIAVWGVLAQPLITETQILHQDIGIYAVSGARPIVGGSTLADNDVGLYAADAQPRLGSSLIKGNASYGVRNATSSRCVDAQNNYWGADGGPHDESSAADSCGLGRNRNADADKVTDNVDYEPWLAEEDLPPSRPVLTTPQCGITNRREHTIAGLAIAGATVQLYDNAAPLGDAVLADTSGYFEAQVTLSPGLHALTAVASRDGARTLPSKPLNLTVDTTLDVDPISILFEWGSGSARRSARLRNDRGCSVPCGQAATQGVVDLLPVQTRLTLYVAGAPDRVNLLYAGGVITLTDMGDGWYQGGFVPLAGDFSVEATKGSTVADACQGRMRVQQGGAVFERETGVAVAGATVTCYVLDEEAYEWRVWPAARYDDQVNPQVTGADGRYFFSVPPGEYRIVVEAESYELYRGPVTVVVDEMIREQIGLTHGYPMYLPLVYRH